jgi:transposase
MTEEEASHLRKENAELKEELARKDQCIEELEGLLTSALLRIEELERRLAKESHNSSKPPSSDDFKRKGKKREASRKAKGGQAGHVGHTLEMVETPDQVVIHRPNQCEACQCELGGGEGQIKERRQIHELPVLRLVVTEDQVEILTCLRCQHQTAGTFPNDVPAPAQYGPRVQALAVSLSQYQLLPMERIGEVFKDLLSCSFSR